MRRSLLAVDERVLYDTRITDSEYRLLIRMILNFGTRLFNADSQTFTLLKVSKSTFYRQVVNLMECQYLQHVSGTSQYSVSVSIVGLKSIKHETESLNNETVQSHVRDSLTEIEREEREKREEEKEKRTKREKEEEKKEQEEKVKGSAIASPTADIELDNESQVKKRRTKEYQEITDYLNAKTGRHYSAKSKATQHHISARLDEGFSVDDFKKVIDIKCFQWGDDPKMKPFLRPETLFSQKFDRYLNEEKFVTRLGAHGEQYIVTEEDMNSDIPF